MVVQRCTAVFPSARDLNDIFTQLSKKMPKLLVILRKGNSTLGWRFFMWHTQATAGMNRQSIRNIGCAQVSNGTD